MDPNNNQIDEAKIEAIVQDKLSDKLKPIIIALLVLYLIVTPIGLFFINNPSFLQNGQANNQDLKISCPISSGNCNTGKTVDYNGNPAVAYNLPPNTQVTSPIQIADSQQFILPPYTTNDPIGLYQSFVIGNTCYTITYTVPPSAKIQEFGVLPIVAGTQLITLASDFIKIGNEDANFVFQIQKRPVDPSLANAPDTQKCPVYSLKPQDFGSYENINQDIFNN